MYWKVTLERTLKEETESRLNFAPDKFVVLDKPLDFSIFFLIKDWTRHFLSSNPYLIFHNFIILMTIIVIPVISLKLNVHIVFH